jgi:hypothetical protein
MSVKHRIDIADEMYLYKGSKDICYYLNHYVLEMSLHVETAPRFFFYKCPTIHTLNKVAVHRLQKS